MANITEKFLLNRGFVVRDEYSNTFDLQLGQMFMAFRRPSVSISVVFVNDYHIENNGKLIDVIVPFVVIGISVPILSQFVDIQVPMFCVKRKKQIKSLYKLMTGHKLKKVSNE